MNLNAGIIFEHLRKTFDAKMHGRSLDRLHLGRPTIYIDTQDVFEEDCLYLASADHLPAHPVIRRNVVLVCVGDSVVLRRYLRACTVIQIEGDADFLSVYLALQDIFNRYDTWNNGLFELFKKDADIAEIVSLSSKCFGFPILVIDGNFRILAASLNDEEGAAQLWKDEKERLSQYSLKNYLSTNEIRTDEHEPMFLKSVDTCSVSVNLFDTRDRYIGCLSILVGEERPQEGLEALAAYLARIIEAAIVKNPALLVTEHSTRKNVLRDLVDGVPISPSRRRLLDVSGDAPCFACVTLHAFLQDQALPSSFICSSFEQTFPGSYAFPANQVVVGVIDLSEVDVGSLGLKGGIGAALDSLTDSFKLGAGISFDFADLQDTPVYMQQAESAFIDGSIMHPERSVHYFEDYALMELVVNATAQLPVESLFPREFRLIVEHDRTSPISYLETLRVFLDENMNYSKVANMLYIHRSTLVDRINKIEHTYGLDLHDPNTRLYLQLIMKAMEIEEAVKASG